MPDRERFYAPLRRAARAAVVFIGHTFLGMVVVTCNWLVERYFHFLWQSHEPLLFERVPLRWLFDAVDLGVLLVFMFWGILEANQKLRTKL